MATQPRGDAPVFPHPAGVATEVDWTSGVAVSSGAGGAGMTLREWYAGKSLEGVFACYASEEMLPTAEKAAELAVAYADAMLAELAKDPPTP